MAVAIVVSFSMATAGCSDTSKVVDYDWTAGSNAARSKIDAQAVAAQPCPEAAARLLPPGHDAYDALRELDRQGSASNACAERARSAEPAMFAKTMPALRASAVAKVCTDTGADEIRVTWTDFEGNRLTEAFGCTR